VFLPYFAVKTLFRRRNYAVVEFQTTWSFEIQVQGFSAELLKNLAPELKNPYKAALILNFSVIQQGLITIDHFNS